MPSADTLLSSFAFAIFGNWLIALWCGIDKLWLRWLNFLVKVDFVLDLQVAILLKENSASCLCNCQIIRRLLCNQIKFIMGRCAILLILWLNHALFSILLCLYLLTETRTLFFIVSNIITAITLVTLRQLLCLFVALLIIEQEKLRWLWLRSLCLGRATDKHTLTAKWLELFIMLQTCLLFIFLLFHRGDLNKGILYFLCVFIVRPSALLHQDLLLNVRIALYVFIGKSELLQMVLKVLKLPSVVNP